MDFITTSMHRTKIVIGCAFFALGVFILSGMAATEQPLVPLEHDAYIWQRSWRPALLEAISTNKNLVRAWRVLAAQVSPTGKLLPVSINPKALEGSGPLLIMVVRIDGQLPNFDQLLLLDEVLALHQQWRDQGLKVAGIEIDHDCGTAKLPGYAKFLAKLRGRLERTTQLSITALPAWLASSHLVDVLGAIDESVLQVHSVQNPSNGLFDQVQASKWIADYGNKSPTVFRVALPTYGSRIGFDDFGNVAFVESESALGQGQTKAQELIVAPESVRQLMNSLNRDAPKNFRGYAWFRLPTNEDQRAWSIATWRALIQGKPLTQVVGLIARPTSDPRLFDLVARNDGETDASPPTQIKLAANCSDADGLGVYAAKEMEGRFWLVRNTPSLLHPQREINVGWARCEENPSKALHDQS